MQLATLSATVIISLSLISFSAQGVKKEIIKEVNICKRNDPQIQKCFCDNYNRMIPVIKNGVPEMNLIQIDPMQIEHLQIDFPEVTNFYFRTDLSNVTLHGMSLGTARHCRAYMTEIGPQMDYEFVFPMIELKSKYKINGRYLLFMIQGDGDFHGKFGGLVVSTIWNSTRFMKHGKEHLKYTTKFTDLKIKTIYVHFTNVFGNNTALNENFNDFLNTNAVLVYNEIKPVILQTIKELSVKVIKKFYDTFPFDILYPH